MHVQRSLKGCIGGWGIVERLLTNDWILLSYDCALWFVNKVSTYFTFLKMELFYN